MNPASPRTLVALVTIIAIVALGVLFSNTGGESALTVNPREKGEAVSNATLAQVLHTLPGSCELSSETDTIGSQVASAAVE